MDSSSPEIGFAFIYFDHKEARPNKTADYIAGLLRQLEQQRETLTSSVQNVYDELCPKGHRPDLHVLTRLLLESASLFKSRTYIVLDAIDELTETARRGLVESLRKLLVSSPSQVYLFITTRPHIRTDLFPSSLSNEIQMINVEAEQGPQIQDMKYYVDVKLSRAQIKDQERLFLSEGIITKAKGLYII